MKGFTLIELLVAIAIIAVLSAVGIIVFETAQTSGYDGRRIADIGQVSNTLETYYTNNNGFPQSASGCTSSTTPCDFSPSNFGALIGSYFSGGTNSSTTTGMPVDPSSTSTAPVYYQYYSCPGTNLPKAYVICATLSAQNTGNVNQKASVNACNFTYSTSGSNNYYCKTNKLQGQ